MRNLLRWMIYSGGDLFYRLRNSIRRTIRSRSSSGRDVSKSDSENTFYVDAVKSILSDENSFRRFRRIYDYREILEHVDLKTGRKYFEKIVGSGFDLRNFLDSVKQNDSVGKPRLYRFGSIGLVSPTTLRYVSVALDLQQLFGPKLNHVVEIGGGYGGQASILGKMNFFEKYAIFDLPEVQELARRYLSAQKIEKVTFPSLFEAEISRIDLVISNYAFSELPRSLQEDFLREIFMKSDRGFLIMNSGIGRGRGRSEGKLSLEELKGLLPGLRVLEENPKTGPENYVLIWSRS